MIESTGGLIPFICHVFLILFGGFFALNFILNKNFVKNSIGYESVEASYMGRPLGFLMLGLVLSFIATLFKIGGYSSTNEIFTVLLIFFVLAFFYNLSLVLKILPTHNGESHDIKNAIRPLIPLIVVVIYFFTI